MTTAEIDRRWALVDAYQVAATVTAGVRPEQLEGPTPCPKMDVAALVDHLVGAGFRAAALGRGQEPEAVAEEFPHVALEDAPALLGQAGSEAAQAWSEDESLAREVTMPWGEVYAGAYLVDMYLSELVAHAWDLARATGQGIEVDEDLASEALAAARAMLQPQYRNAMEPGSPFGDEVEPPEGASTLDRFAAFMGRDPAAS